MIRKKYRLNDIGRFFLIKVHILQDIKSFFKFNISLESDSYSWFLWSKLLQLNFGNGFDILSFWHNSNLQLNSDIGVKCCDIIFLICILHTSGISRQFESNTEGSCLMLLLGPGKKSHQPKIALAKFLSYVCSNKINSP